MIYTSVFFALFFIILFLIIVIFLGNSLLRSMLENLLGDKKEDFENYKFHNLLKVRKLRLPRKLKRIQIYVVKEKIIPKKYLELAFTKMWLKIQY